MEIKYVKMPISEEQKKEYNRQGFRVIDAQFAPEGSQIEEAKEIKSRQQRSRNSDED